MAAQREEDIAHLFRRAGLGASAADVDRFARLGVVGFASAVSFLVNYQTQPDDVDAHIGGIGLGASARPCRIRA